MIKKDISCLKKTLIKIKLQKLLREREHKIGNIVRMFPKTIEKMEKIEVLMPEAFKKIDSKIGVLQRILK